MITKVYWKWLIAVHHNKTKQKNVMGSPNLKANSFKTEDSVHFRYDATPFGNQFLIILDNYIISKHQKRVT